MNACILLSDVTQFGGETKTYFLGDTESSSMVDSSSPSKPKWSLLFFYSTTGIKRHKCYLLNIEPTTNPQRFDSEGLFGLMLHLDGTTDLFQDDIYVTSNKLSDLLPFSGLHRVVPILVVSKVLSADHMTALHWKVNTRSVEL